MSEERLIIPIVFATDDNYVPYLGVAIYSLISKVSQNNEYKIYILTQSVSKEHKQKLLDLAQGNVYIEIIDVTNKCTDYQFKQSNASLPQATSIRLLVDQIMDNKGRPFQSLYKKILYLDSDIIIMKDIAELYKENITGFVIGAVRGLLDVWLKEQIDRYVPLKNGMQGYFNAGVLLINLCEFDEMEIGNKGLHMLGTGVYPCADQDVLNILCEGRVKYFDFRWNVEWHYQFDKIEDILVDEMRENEWKARQDPFIIHYTSPVKPWSNLQGFMAECFWNNARKSCFYEEILYKKMDAIIEEKNTMLSNEKICNSNDGIGDLKENVWERFIFPWHLIEPGSHVIIRGGGVVGRMFVEQLRLTQYAKVVAICDYKLEPFGNVPIVKPESLLLMRYDAIIIAIEKPSIAKEMYDEMCKLGISTNKIYYIPPMR